MAGQSPIETCRDAVFWALARLEARTGREVFRLAEIVREVREVTTRYPEHTIRTQVTSVMCADAPVHHQNHTDDLQRVGRGQYRRIVPDPRAGNRRSDHDAKAQASHGEPTLILVGCVSEKRPEPAPAKDLYRSALWSRRRRYAEGSGQPWFVLSAKHGILHPDTVIEPYNVSLSHASRSEAATWASRVLLQVTAMASALGAHDVEIHAGELYTPVLLLAGLKEAGLTVRRPLAGLRIGQQLQWYDRDGSSPNDVVSDTRKAVPKPVTVYSEVSDDMKVAVAARLLECGGSAEMNQPPEVAVFVPSNIAAEEYLRENPFAFLVAVIFDQGIVAERAWEAPYLLKERLGHLDPVRLQDQADDIKAAVAQPPALHRYVNNVPEWVAAAAERVMDRYQGDAGRIWGDRPSASELQQRLEAFVGIGPKKAAMAVEILIRHFGVEVSDLSGTNLAYDVHVRRVFLRSGLADVDDQEHMLHVARRLNPSRPGALDGPAWTIGREWCHPRHPDCPACPLTVACPKLIGKGSAVKGA